MEKLTNKQITTICDSVIKEMNAAKKSGERQYLDLLIKRKLVKIEYKELYEIKIEDHIEHFTLENAKIMANADPNEFDNTLWWDGSKTNFDYDNRILFMEFIKGCYEN